ncbi:MAG: hypothetical protein FWG54_04250 [Bacteroidetes bacterium]|nr:hypothetical protein [Bacteroidota bacterium]
MKNSENFLEIQKALFEEVQKKLPKHHSLVESVSEVLHIGADSAYRRIRCDKLLNISEIYALCAHFNLSFDILTGATNKYRFNCMYRPVNSSVPGEYQNYILSLSQNFERLRAAEGSRILLSAMDIPLFHLLTHKELRFFKLFTYADSVYKYAGSWDDFVKEMETLQIIECHQKISRDYELIPSFEIWTNGTIDPTLKLISYYVDMSLFPDQKLPLLLCNQVLSLLNKLHQWVQNGYKDQCATPFQLFLSEMDLENTYILMKQAQTSNCVVKLFTINHLNIFDEAFCRETEDWLIKLSYRSVPLSGSSEKERVKFFNAQRHKVRLLMRKIKTHFEANS